MEDFGLYDPNALLSVPPTPPVPTIDQAGRDLLVRTVIGEADGEPLPGQAGVAHVVLNRLKSGSFGKSLEDVLFAPKQFEPWGARRDELMAIPTNDPRYQQAAAVVDGALAGKLADPTRGATHFANPEIVARRGNSDAMRWINAMAENGSGIRIGKHAFGNPDAPAQPQAEQPAAQPAAARAPQPFFRPQTIPVRAGVDMDGISPGARGVFDSLTKLGIPGLEVVSGYRDPERNARAGGAKGSQHLHGNAIDINIANLTPEQRQQVLDTAISSGARGIGIYPGGRSLHLDVRDTPAAWGANANAPYSGVADPNAYPEWARGGITRLFAGQGGAPVVQASAYAPADRPRASQPTYEQRQALLGAVPLDANGFTRMRMPNVQNADVTQAEPMTLTGMLMSPERMLPGKAPLAAMPTIPGAIDPSFVYRDGPRPVERAPEPTARDMVARLGDRRGTQGRSLADRPAAGAGYAEGPTRMMPTEDYSNAGDGGIRADIASRAGGLGGLGGFVIPGTDTTVAANPAAAAGGGGMDVGTVLQAIGMSLMSGDRRNPMKNFATIFNTLQTAANGQAKTAQEQYALASALKMSGMNDQQARLFAVNPTAAKIAVDQLQVQQARGQEEAFGRRVAGIGASQPSAPIPDRVSAPTTQPPPFAAGNAPAQASEAPLPVPTQSSPAPVQAPAQAAPSPAPVPQPQALKLDTGNKTVDTLFGKRAAHVQEYDALARELAAAPTPRAKDMVESRLKAIEKRIGQVDKQIDQYSPTSGVKEYAFAMTQRRAQGLPIVPFEKWDPAADRKTAAGPSPDEIAGMRKEVQSLPSYKNVAQAAPVYRSMLDAAGRDDRASDVNLIYGMAKLMDPGSVVRESEMTVAQAIATLPQQIQNSIKSQFTQTGRLSQDVREGLMREAYSRMSSYNQLFDQDAGMYRGIVGRRGMNEADVLPSFGEFKPYQRPEKPGAMAGNAPKAGAVEDGFRFKGGNPADPSNWEKAN